MHKPGMVSIWFLIGMLLVAYGLLILGTGIYDAVVPPDHPTVLANLHAGIWWGLLVLALGCIYCWRFEPRKTK
jgi:ABC-type microcin C transport system permease subunit YejB